ncbi:MAG: protein kinase [Prevotella sp.]|nr:protein kinase [Prevotella sp.]
MDSFTDDNTLRTLNTQGNAAGKGLTLDDQSTFKPTDKSAMSQPSFTFRAERTVQGDTATPTTNDDNDTFFLKGKTYKSIKCLSDSSGEAQVFLVEHDGTEYVLKIYYPNFDVNKKLLLTIRSFQFEMIVRLYDFGKTYVNGKHRYYELMEYLRGGTLNHYKLGHDMNRFRRIALQGAAALAYCHNNNILHKDIKPGNFFFRDDSHEELVLGDFGISSMLEKDGKAHRTTQARTPIYAAPEMYTDVIDGVVELTPAADFYSLGITLFTLWLEENPLSANERIMMRQKNEGRLPRLNELPEEVKHIVQGLTAVNPMNRWGLEEVEKWFQGEEVPVDISSPYLRYKSFIVDPERNLVADNVHELIPLLVDNERLAIGYLYNGRISQWLESCGNVKLATVVKDIVVNRYPVDQHAGLIASVYAMEPTYPYTDVTGNVCDDIHDIAISLLSYQDQYGMLLRNPNDSLFLYLESHTKCDIDRLRSYFGHSASNLDHVNNKKIDTRIAILKCVFEIDKDIPFLTKYQSSTIEDIVRAFGNEKLTDDDWHSLTDGRLLSWMLNHEDMMACESLRILTRGQQYSDALAYKVLYNLDRKAAYDLKGANTPEKVGHILNKRLQDAEHLDDKEFAKALNDFADPNGRFAYFAQLHGWVEVLAESGRTFDFKSEENKERLGSYDLKTAAYRFCRILGVTPTYLLPDGTELTDGRSISPNTKPQVMGELRNGNLAQWMAVFYHEDPARDFSEQYSYEHELEKWVLALGEIDKTQTFYKRFVDACNETSRKMNEVRTGWQNAKRKENTWRYTFYGLCAVWMLLVLIFGVSGRDFMLRHSFITIGMPLGGMTAIIVATRAYFRGYGSLMSALWGLVGALSAFIPIWVMKFCNTNAPGLFNIAIVLMTLVYMLVCHLTDFRGDEKADNKLINEVMEDDIQSTLIEPLYYTFKTKSYRFKGSKFGLLDDVSDQVRSISGESVLHYILWSLLVAGLVAEFVVFSPKLLNLRNPYLDSNWKLQPTKVIKQLERDVE